MIRGRLCSLASKRMPIETEHQGANDDGPTMASLGKPLCNIRTLSGKAFLVALIVLALTRILSHNSQVRHYALCLFVLEVFVLEVRRVLHRRSKISEGEGPRTELIPRGFCAASFDFVPALFILLLLIYVVLARS